MVTSCVFYSIIIKAFKVSVSKIMVSITVTYCVCYSIIIKA